ncbi:TRAP transporter permease [Rappaport israeli]|uniref:TRAP transporter permease n=1 Tax=Rappaport israeli TaxID=1839807 RepID=UPI000931361A|nr:TRAP transporter permease [Rappaport israeli]
MSNIEQSNARTGAALPSEDLQDLVASNDTGGRSPTGATKKVIVWTAIIWSIFQIYYASPLPFMLQNMLNSMGIHSLNVVVDDTRARSIHLSFAIFLAFLSYPAFKHSPKYRVPAFDWLLAVVGAFLASYYLFFYGEIVKRVGAPNLQDIVVGCMGIVLLLEATRRSLGLPLVLIASVFLIYNFVGQYFPMDWMVAHRSGSINQIINQQWITTEGVFGVALGVSTKYVFLFVLFGALLDKAGAGNYFIKTAFAYLGHYRGGPAKAAVVASGLTGLISGSSIANVVTTGTFTVPMMKRVGFSAEKAGAVEVASSVNGQIMPPVMGAAAFLMIEYVNMPYNELIKHAFLPAVISYIALVYIVHLEACKQNLVGLERTDPPNPLLVSLLRAVGAFVVVGLIYFAVKYGLGWLKVALPDAAFVIVALGLLAVYGLLIYRVSQFEDLKMDDANEEMVKLPSVRPTVNAGLHYLLPVVVLIWCLMVERMSPGLSAFWGTMALIFIQLTQRSLLAFFRKQSDVISGVRLGFQDLLEGLEMGARNMIGIGIATATAGIIVGVVALTGFGTQLSNIIEFISGGNLLIMLAMVAVFSLILGMGLPTTANYIVVSSLMAVVIVEVGRQNGLVVPLIAVHLFVFYFGIMADVTPPVGLASFAAAAVSGGDPIKTGLVAFFYSLRTALLPFLFIFNTDLLLIDVGWLKGILTFVVATIAILAFTAATMGWFFAKNKWWEMPILLLATFMLFRPGFFMDYVSPSTQEVLPRHFVEKIGQAPVGDDFMLFVRGLNPYGKEITFYARVPIAEGTSGQERLDNMGMTIIQTGNMIEFEGRQLEEWLIDDVALGSVAANAGLDWDQTILSASLPRHGNWAKEWMFIPGLMLLAVVAWRQIRRRRLTDHLSVEKAYVS